jgi:hypothetical protein
VLTGIYPPSAIRPPAKPFADVRLPLLAIFAVLMFFA